MSDQDLQKIQTLQFTDIDAANKLLKAFFQSNLPFEVETVNVRPLAVSLNSINGFLTTGDGKKLFFKTHVEPQSIIHEYYNSSILAEAGYPVIQPIFSSTEWGKQLLIYEFFDSPSLFNVARELETGQRQDLEQVVSIQQQADEELREIYLKTLQQLEAKEHASAPIHQLFYHRLTGGRFNSFYQGKNIILPTEQINFDNLAQMQWVINGVKFQDTLDELVQLATKLLNPSRGKVPSIVGHGDAHNGNVFIDTEQASIIYFDPAFAGRHSPLLDLTKPLFHNVFAIWMYFPREIASILSIKLEITNNTLVVEHDFAPTTVRVAFLKSKLHRVLKPILKELKSRVWLATDWREYLKLALFCCPFLTMNLSDTQRFPPEITLLGLAISMEMGSRGQNSLKTLLDQELDTIAAQL
ncbi:MAG: hypothetical protein F6K58_13865 [Symploca sp. SIO2E9]|nr:hypothetical protein [Symploca sp. SIO2E9]